MIYISIIQHYLLFLLTHQNTMLGSNQRMFKQPSMNLYNKLNAGKDYEDDDDYVTDSFTKSRVDDDDDKFANRDPDLYDIFGKKQTPNRKKEDSKFPFTTPPISQPVKKEPLKTPPEPKQSTPVKETQARKPVVQVEKQAAKPEPVSVSDTPTSIQPMIRSKKDITPSSKRPEPVELFEVSQPIEQIDRSDKPKPVVSAPKPRPASVQKKAEPVKRNKRGANSIDFDQLQRPQFVRKGKNNVNSLVSELNSYDKTMDRIRAYFPNNKKECMREYVLKENPKYNDEKSKDVYYDMIFPPNYTQVEQLPWKNKKDVQFQRAQDYYKRPVQTYSVIDPNDITPGKFETQQLLSVLSALGEQPKILARILEGQRVNAEGFYYVRLFVDGVWRFIPLDDMLCAERSRPADDERVSKLAKNSIGYETELWVSLIEKALAKVYGSYEDMQFGSLEDFMWELTGAPVVSDCEQLGVVEISDIELPEGLMINVLGVEKGQVKLRNPWGWSSGSSYARQAGKEGEFTMSEKEFQNKVQQCWSTCYVDGYWSISHSVKQLVDNYSGFQVKVADESVCYWSIVQLDQRYFRNNLVQKYKYSFVRILVISEDGDLITSVHGQKKYVSTGEIKVYGNYYVFVIYDWETKPYESTLSYYGSTDIKIAQTDKNADVLGRLMGQVAMKQGKKQPSKGAVSEYHFIDDDLRLFSIGWQSDGNGQVRKDLSKYTILRKPSNLVLSFSGIEGVVGKSSGSGGKITL